MNLKRISFIGLMTMLAVSMFGCITAQGPAPQAASSSGLSAGNMQLSARMSNSIFLQPVSPTKRVVYVYGHNTSGAQGLRFMELIKAGLVEKGYRITDDPDKAQYMLMYNILYVGKEDKSYTAEGALAGGFGGALLGNVMKNNATGTEVGGLVGAGLGAIIGSVYHDDQYMMVTDIQVEQRQTGTYTETNTHASQGTDSTLHTYHSGIKGWMVYRDRVVSQAKGHNMAFDYATPSMSKEVSGEISGLF
ncbi:MAG: complement resistance protein TraT [Nitrospiraceae bacterium]|nr:complement resistance protein TraT [Nitrospiraceae bacterium]